MSEDKASGNELTVRMFVKQDNNCVERKNNVE
jgi:hypothetical protein